MRTSKVGLALIEEFEGWKKKLPDGRYTAYLDTLPKKAFWSKGYKGLWTIGPGITGPDVTRGTIMTREALLAKFAKMLREHEDALNAKLKLFKLKLDQNEYDALISASWNLGHESTLITRVLTKLKADDEAGAANVFLEYKRAGGRVYAGLLRRRKAERELFLKHTVQTLYAASPKLSWMRRGRNFIASLGIGTYFTWDTLSNLHQYASDHIGLTLVVLAALAWVSFKAVEYFLVQDHFAGRFDPEGDAEGETA
jgi:lysozyme